MAQSREQTAKPTIGVTMGDPSGVGPEIVVKALNDRRIRGLARFVVYGLNELMAYAADQMEIEPYWFRVQHDSGRSGRRITENVVVLDFDEFDGFIQSPRRPSKSGGIASKTFVEEAVSDSLRPVDHPRHLDALVTGPVCKESWHTAGFKWPGHTELLANRTKAKRHAMMFVSPRLRVILATAHVPLNEIRNVLTIGRVFDPIDLGYQACRDLGIERPVIAVTGLNPHAGEGGHIGDEEIRLIEPAIEVARQAGINVQGPFPADTIFIEAASGAYDLVVAMYHDQGLIPVKLLGWDHAVNLTVGLPIIRTSPDHGTAFDIAGRNTASDGSFKAAIELAAQLAVNRMAAAAITARKPSEPAA
jgi:4-hydroxythreonine-4-phosphate dehydrogenase